MRVRFVAILGVATLITTPIVPRAARAGDEPPTNLLVNGSFEEGPKVSTYVPVDEDSEEIKGWVVTRGQIDYLGSHWKAAEGTRSLDLNGSPGFGGIKQSFATTKGRKYRVTFSMAGTPSMPALDTSTVKVLCVRAAGKKEAFSADGADKTPDDPGWTKKTWEFTATDDKTTLEFQSLDYDHPLCGPLLDDVSVVEVKE